MIVLTVVTAPRPLRGSLRPAKGGSAGKGGFPTCTLARSFRGSVRASSEDRFDIFRIALWGACLPMSLPEARP